ncbi:MAG: hypothetical protein C4533_04805 [Candidatus Omnitrophota bacterium]|jgi:hypothetical protein|nr:MAG: hypothetical protein C4533_04805 [Candidatus Omnitrophota bacterium]
MQAKNELFIKHIFRNWKKKIKLVQDSAHPDEESLACFLDNKLSHDDKEKLKAHVLNCSDCLELLVTLNKLRNPEAKDAPAALLEGVKSMASAGLKDLMMDIALAFRGQIIELLHSSGDILLGQELVSASVLRSRKINNFRDEIIILKDFDRLRVELKIDNKRNNKFQVQVTMKDKDSQKLVKELRVTLLKDDLTLESYIGSSGVVVFEEVMLGKYRLEITSDEKAMATIVLDIKQFV